MLITYYAIKRLIDILRKRNFLETVELQIGLKNYVSG